MINHPFTFGNEQFLGMFSQLGEQFQKMSGQFSPNMFNNSSGFFFDAAKSPWEDYFQKMSKPTHQAFSFMQNIREFSDEMIALTNKYPQKDSEEYKQEYKDLLIRFSNSLYKNMANIDSLGMIRHMVETARNYTKLLKNSDNPFNGALNMPSIGPMNGDIKKFKKLLQIMEDCGRSFEDLVSLFEGMDKKTAMIFIDLCLKKECDENTKVMEYFDLWVKAFETEYKNLTSTATFSEYYGRFTNSSLSYRAFMQEYIDDSVEQFGLPSKRATDTMLKHISSLRKQNRELSEKIEDLQKIVFNSQKEINASNTPSELKMAKSSAVDTQKTTKPKSKPSAKKSKTK